MMLSGITYYENGTCKNLNNNMAIFFVNNYLNLLEQKPINNDILKVG